MYFSEPDLNEAAPGDRHSARALADAIGISKTEGAFHPVDVRSRRMLSRIWFADRLVSASTPCPKSRLMRRSAASREKYLLPLLLVKSGFVGNASNRLGFSVAPVRSQVPAQRLVDLRPGVGAVEGHPAQREGKEGKGDATLFLILTLSVGAQHLDNKWKEDVVTSACRDKTGIS